MRIKVLFFGALKEIVGRAEESVTLEEGSTVSRLYALYEERYPSLARHSASLLFSRNREFAARAECLREGDEVAFLPPVSGGSGDPVGLAEGGGLRTVLRLTRSPIDTRALMKELLRGRDGAMVVFEGVVRDHTGDRKTLYLEYEGYEAMALAKLGEIDAEIRQKFSIDSVGIVHRLGRLEIGEASVAIVVSSEHRGPAFEASRYAIDRLKRIVPIWKKEFFADGAVWSEGERDGCAEPPAAAQTVQEAKTNQRRN